MSVRPVTFRPTEVDVYHDERGHDGTVSLTSLQFASKPDGAVDFRFLILPCPFPGCGSVSTHPVGGGAAPGQVQRLFVRMYLQHASHPAKSLREAFLAAKALAEAMDGPGRWKLSEQDV